MVKHFVLGGLFTLLTTSIFAQKQTGQSEGVIVEQKSDPSSYKNLEDGTYQFLITKANYRPLITQDLFDRIQQGRKEYEDVQLVIDEHITLFLPSKNKINSSGFVPLEKYKYLN